MKTAIAILIVLCAVAQAQSTIPIHHDHTIGNAEWSLCYTNGGNRPYAITHTVDNKVKAYPIIYVVEPQEKPSFGGIIPFSDEGNFTNHIATAEELLANLKRETNYVAAINLLFTTGEVCKTRGHKWAPGCGMNGCLVIHYGEQRHCAICGTYQSRSMSPWPGETQIEFREMPLTNIWIPGIVYTNATLWNATGTNLVYDTNILATP